MGISRNPQDGGDLKTLTKLADAAVYQAKTEKNNYKIYGTIENLNGHR